MKKLVKKVGFGFNVGAAMPLAAVWVVVGRALEASGAVVTIGALFLLVFQIFCLVVAIRYARDIWEF